MNAKKFLGRIANFRAIVIKSFFVLFSLLLLSCFFYDTKKENSITEKILREAREATENENFIEAFDLYNLLLFFDKTSKEGILDLTKLYEKFREYNKAIELIRNYKKMVPKDRCFDSMLGELYYKIEDYRDALTYLGDKKISLLKKAICFEKIGNLASADSLYTSIAPSFNAISDFLSTRIAYSQLAKGVPESTVDLFNKLEKAIKDREEKYVVEKDLLDYFFKDKKYDEALRFVSLMEEDFPEKRSLIELEQANIFFAMGNEEVAFQLYHKILNEGDIGAYGAGIKLLNASKLLRQEYMKLAELCYSRGDYSNARNLLVGIVKESDSNHALYLLGMSYYRVGQNKKAAEIFIRLQDRYPEKKQTILYYLGKTEERIGDFKSALKDYTKAGENKKSRFADNALYLSGLLKENQGNLNAAIKIYKRIKEKFEKGDCVFKAMLRGGILSYKMNSLSLAEGFFNKALVVSENDISNYVSTLYWLSRLAEKRGNITKRDSIWNIIKTRTPLSFYSFYLGNSNLTTKEVNTKKWLSTWTDTTLSLTEDEKIYWQRGNIFLDLRLVSEARKSFSHINQTPYVYYILAKLFKEKGFDYESIHYALKIKAMSPGGYLSKAPTELLRMEYPLLYLPTIVEKSRKYGVEPEIIVALIHQESAFKRNAVSIANATGLSQLLPSVAKQVARNNIIDYDGPEELKKKPELSIELGIAHFSELQKKFGRFEFSLAAYNAGQRKAKEWESKWKGDFPIYLDMITYSETRRYVKRVLAKREIYNLLWHMKQGLKENLRIEK